jgi:hypothetical protein
MDQCCGNVDCAGQKITKTVRLRSIHPTKADQHLGRGLSPDAPVDVGTYLRNILSPGFRVGDGSPKTDHTVLGPTWFLH